MTEIRHKYFMVSKALLLNLNLIEVPFPSKNEQTGNQESE